MSDLIHQFITHRAQNTPDATALLFKDQSLSYTQLQSNVEATANGLLALGIAPGERVAVYLPKQPETVFGPRRIYANAQVLATGLELRVIFRKSNTARVLSINFIIISRMDSFFCLLFSKPIANRLSRVIFSGPKPVRI